MKYRILKLVLFLLLGAAINIVVAWVCAISIRASDAYVELAHGKESASPLLWNWSRSGVERAMLLRELWSKQLDESDGAVFASLVPRWSDLDQKLAGKLDLQGPTIQEYVCVDGRGWPMISMWSEQRLALNPLSSSHSPFISGGIDLGIAEQIYVEMPVKPLLPVRIIWPGFAINTIFYAAIVWMLLAFPGVVRRRMRAHRGRCAACGYDLRASENKLCPECGASASRPS